LTQAEKNEKKINMKRIFILIFLFPILVIGQENPLEIFKPLENYIWNDEGKWADGSLFKQEVSLSISIWRILCNRNVDV